MLLDQILLKYQCFGLIGRNRYLDISNMAHQRHGLGVQTRCAKITRYSVFEFFSLTNVQHLIVLS